MVLAVALLVVALAQSQPPAGAQSEKFDTAAPQGWVLTPGAEVEGGVLSCNDMGHGIWIAAFPADFSLSLRYKHGQGIGQVLFRGTGDLPKDNDYRLRLDGMNATLARAELGQEKILKVQPLALQAGTWHDIIIQVVGGQVSLSVDGKTILSANDPSPLANGIMGFGCIGGKNFAYDDISVAPAQ
jgi:hypothetical protein